ncbi:MAG: hypothetical protein JST00_02570 [Deltaproteobacteria bacterium]|nr:hypothetical protein [Deltaproteobacteria bacterium]
MSRSDKKDENGMGEPNAATHPDPIPPVHVLEAAADQEKKETEDLLAGFDRPGRGPKKPEGERDFVEYFAKKKGDARGTPTPPPAGVRAGAAAQPARPKQVDIATVVVPRDKKPALAPWLIAGALMLATGGVVAFLATRGDGDANARKTAGVGATTTITNASPPPSTQSSHDEIPPPPPASEVATSTTEPASAAPPVESPSSSTRSTASASASGSGAKKRDPKSGGSASSASGSGPSPAGTTPVTSTGAPMVAPSSKPPPRDDLIRGM